MDAPRIALRFRDPAGVDSIAEHRKIVAVEGAVWWGWWKKATEEVPLELLEALQKEPGTALLIDRTTQRCFRATILQVRPATGKGVKRSRVPSYYRKISNEIPVWFLLKDIVTETYPDLLVEQIGERTMLELDGKTKDAIDDRQWEVVGNRERDTLLHLSDLHFGTDHGFLAPGTRAPLGDLRRGLAEAILESLIKKDMSERIACIVITGDFTTRGDWSDKTIDAIVAELSKLTAGLKLQNHSIVAIPGNHDILRYPAGSPVDATAAMVDHLKDYEHETGFRRMMFKLTGRDINKPLHWVTTVHLKPAAVQLCALNSCTVVACGWTEYGYVGAGGIQILEKLRKSNILRPTYRLMALHHHLVPVARLDAPNADGVSLTLDAIELMDAADRAGVRIALHGHQHLPRVAHYRKQPNADETPANYGGLVISSVGSAGVMSSRRLSSVQNSYSLLSFSDHSVDLSTWELYADGTPGRNLLRTTLDISPLRG